MLAGILRRLFGGLDKSDRAIFTVMLVCGIIGLTAALALSIERIQQLQDPNAVLLCNINAIFNCGTVMQTWQAGVLGFPNSFIGLISEAVVITVAVAGLTGVQFPRRFMFAAQIGFTLGLIFAYWLFFESLYDIQVLCPWCLLVTVSTTIMVAALTRYNIQHNNLFLPHEWSKRANRFLLRDYDKFLTAGWLALMVVLVLIKFPGIF